MTITFGDVVMFFFERTRTTLCQFPCLVPCGGVFLTLWAVWWEKSYLGSSPQTPKIACYSCGNNILNIFLLEGNLKTKSIDFVCTQMSPQWKPHPFSLGTCRHPCAYIHNDDDYDDADDDDDVDDVDDDDADDEDR